MLEEAEAAVMIQSSAPSKPKVRAKNKGEWMEGEASETALPANAKLWQQFTVVKEEMAEESDPDGSKSFSRLEAILEEELKEEEQ